MQKFIECRAGKELLVNAATPLIANISEGPFHDLPDGRQYGERHVATVIVHPAAGEQKLSCFDCPFPEKCVVVFDATAQTGDTGTDVVTD